MKFRHTGIQTANMVVIITTSIDKNMKLVEELVLNRRNVLEAHTELYLCERAISTSDLHFQTVQIHTSCVRNVAFG